MDRDAKTQASLIALARTRRVQRATAHAYMHRNAPMPTLRSSLGFMMSTATVAADVRGIEHRMSLLGIARDEGVAYVVEDLGPDESPTVYRLWLRGPRQGYLVPLHAWYEHEDSAADIRARIAKLAPTLEPLAEAPAAAWMLSTRVVQRRALRVAADALPIRKYALQLVVEPVAGHGPSGKTTVTAYLRANAQLVDVWTLPGGDAAIARISYTGIPSGVGLDKDTVVLLTSGLADLLDPVAESV